jgi:hypothetical protein
LIAERPYCISIYKPEAYFTCKAVGCLGRQFTDRCGIILWAG